MTWLHATSDNWAEQPKSSESVLMSYAMYLSALSKGKGVREGKGRKPCQVVKCKAE